MTALPSRPLRRLPAAAGVLGCASLGAALVAGPGGSIWPSVVLGVLAVGSVLAETTRRAIQLIRSGLGAQIVVGLLGIAVFAAAWSVVVSIHAEFAGGALLLAALGVALVATPLLEARGQLAQGATPWQALTGGPTANAAARATAGRLVPLLLGAFFLLLAVRLIAHQFSTVFSYYSRDGAILAAFGFALLAAGAGWLVARRMAATRPGSTARGAWKATAIAREEQVVAAHLHDSVLQTLALIQRNSDDPARVNQLARQQERSLRAWLAGRDQASSTTLAGALKAAAQEVEDEQPGAVIEVVAVGNGPLDREADAMVRAAREAMRNAARHAGSPVRVFLEFEDGRRELFIRDTGPGFDLGAIGEERRGVRDAIIGRMEHVGGTAEIDSGPGGTEIALMLPAPASSGGPAR